MNPAAGRPTGPVRFEHAASALNLQGRPLAGFLPPTTLSYSASLLGTEIDTHTQRERERERDIQRERGTISTSSPPPIKLLRANILFSAAFENSVLIYSCRPGELCGTSRAIHFCITVHLPTYPSTAVIPTSYHRCLISPRVLPAKSLSTAGGVRMSHLFPDITSRKYHVRSTWGFSQLTASLGRGRGAAYHLQVQQ